MAKVPESRDERTPAPKNPPDLPWFAGGDNPPPWGSAAP